MYRATCGENASSYSPVMVELDQINGADERSKRMYLVSWLLLALD